MEHGMGNDIEATKEVCGVLLGPKTEQPWGPST